MPQKTVRVQSAVKPDAGIAPSVIKPLPKLGPVKPPPKGAVKPPPKGAVKPPPPKGTAPKR